MAITRCSCGKYDVEWNIAYIGMSIKKKNKTRFMNENASGRPVGSGETHRPPANVSTDVFETRVMIILELVILKLFRLEMICFSK